MDIQWISYPAISPYYTSPALGTVDIQSMSGEANLTISRESSKFGINNLIIFSNEMWHWYMYSYI